MWLTTQELIGLPLMPKTPQGIGLKAKQENWERRRKEGVKGNVFEYHISSLPPETQQALRLQAALAVVPIAEMTVQQPNLELSRRFNEASDKAREKAKAKAEACLQLKAFLDQGSPMMSAIEGAAKVKNVSAGSLKNWYYKVQPYPVHEWQAVLITQSGKAKKPSRKAFIEQEAWDCFLADYLRPEKPDLRECYRRTEQLAKHYGWEIASLQTFQRRVLEEIPYEVILLKREGANAVAKLVPALQRTVKDILAGEWINGDGYQHNVFVKWHNGEIVRPKTWFWQDVRTRRILGYRTAISENTDSIRHALMDVIFSYGIPKTITLDNTRAAANKAMTGGIENRYRFKHNELDPKGILPILGIEVHFTSVLYGEGHGQAKPIERAFGRGGIGEKVDKRPELAGFYTGKNVLEKPDNYNGGKDGVDYEIFLQALAAGVAEYNAQLDRKTELCQHDKTLSFDKVWERDYRPSNVRQASPEQLRLLFLQAETISIKRNGEFKLKAAGKLYGLTNTYWAESLIGITDKKVVARFDPDNLHGNVYVYDIEGRFLAEAICRDAKGFNDTSAAREQGRLYQKMVKGAKQQAEALELLNAHELASLQPQVEVPEPIEERVRTKLIDTVIQDRKSLAQQGKSSAQVIDSWHKARGFRRSANAVRHFNSHLSHIGYHFVIDVDGTVETGRQVGEIGAHVKGHNSNSVGICLIGGISASGKNHAEYTEAQWQSLHKLLRELEAKHPKAKIYGHRDLSPDLNNDGKITKNEWLKDCPCFDVWEWLDRGEIVFVEHLFKE